MSILNYSGSFQSSYDFTQSRGRIGLFERIIISETYTNNANELPKIATLTLATASGDQTVVVGSNTIVVPYTTSDAVTAGNIAAEILASGANVYASVVGAVITITGRYGGDDYALSYSGTGGTLAVTQVATTSLDLPYGRIVAYKTGDPSDACRLPTATTDLVLGLAGSDVVIENDPTYNYPVFQRGNLVAVLQQGLGWVEVESDVTRADVPYYRYAADGSLDQLGIVAGAAGTGLTNLTGASFQTDSITVEGKKIALLSVNRP
jgi:hypothetical protein